MNRCYFFDAGRIVDDWEVTVNLLTLGPNINFEAFI